MADKGFSVNDFDHLGDSQRDSSAWGFNREDLEKFKVRMVVNINLSWDESTPPEMRQVFGEAAHVLQHIAEKAVDAQLKHDGLLPTSRENFLLAHEESGEIVVFEQTGGKWEKRPAPEGYTYRQGDKNADPPTGA